MSTCRAALHPGATGPWYGPRCCDSCCRGGSGLEGVLSSSYAKYPGHASANLCCSLSRRTWRQNRGLAQDRFFEACTFDRYRGVRVGEARWQHAAEWPQPRGLRCQSLSKLCMQLVLLRGLQMSTWHAFQSFGHVGVFRQTAAVMAAD